MHYLIINSRACACTRVQLIVHVALTLTHTRAHDVRGCAPASGGMKRLELDIELQPARHQGGASPPAVPGHDAPVRLGHIAAALHHVNSGGVEGGCGAMSDSIATAATATVGMEMLPAPAADTPRAKGVEGANDGELCDDATAQTAVMESRLAAAMARASLRGIARRKVFAERVLGMGVEHPLRRRALDVVDDKAFDQAVITLILVNCVFLALWNPIESPCSSKNNVLDQAEFVFLVLFSVEMALKLVCAQSSVWSPRLIAACRWRPSFASLRLIRACDEPR